jgi:hypothetical protein
MACQPRPVVAEEEDTLDTSRSGPVSSFVVGIIVGFGVLLSLAPAIVKTYGALEVANIWTATQTFQGGFNVTGGTSKLLVSSDCSQANCSATGQVCVSGLNICPCDPTAGFYVCSGSSASTLQLTPITNVPAICSPGAVVHLTNGAFCHCYANNLWEHFGSQGVCQ